MNAPTEEGTVAVFGGRTAKGLATRLSPGRDVRLVSDDRSAVEASRSAPFEARHVAYRTADPSAHVDDASVAVVVAEADRVGLLVAQKIVACDAVDRILVRVDDPEYEAAFRGIDCELLDFASLLHEAVESSLEPTSV